MPFTQSLNFDFRFNCMEGVGVGGKQLKKTTRTNVTKSNNIYLYFYNQVASIPSK